MACTTDHAFLLPVRRKESEAGRDKVCSLVRIFNERLVSFHAALNTPGHLS